MLFFKFFGVNFVIKVKLVIVFLFDLNFVVKGFVFGVLEIFLLEIIDGIFLFIINCK